MISSSPVAAPDREACPPGVPQGVVWIEGGSFLMGSPAGEAGREEDEGPQVTVKVGDFWMGRHEVTWNEYDLYAFARREPSCSARRT